MVNLISFNQLITIINNLIKRTKLISANTKPNKIF